MNDTTQHDDDGFNGSLVGDRLIRGNLLRWKETDGWTDRDGLHPPEPLLVLACSEALQRRQGKKPGEPITAKPFPSLDDLNGAIPKSEWEPGLDGRPKPPWSHGYIVYLIDPASAGFFTYLNSTTGARIAWDQLKEKVITMRALRGARVVPLVKLGRRPMKTNFGMKHRPDFEVIGWRTIGDGGGGIAIANQTPQLAAPAATKKDEPEPVDEAAKTIASLGEVSLPSTAELMQDEIPW